MVAMCRNSSYERLIVRGIDCVIHVERAKNSSGHLERWKVERVACIFYAEDIEEKAVHQEHDSSPQQDR